MDALLLENIGEEFFKKYTVDPRKEIISRFRMLNEIEKQRKILSEV
jgi:molecular chaperone DnaK (HSP70)